MSLLSAVTRGLGRMGLSSVSTAAPVAMGRSSASTAAATRLFSGMGAAASRGLSPATLISRNAAPSMILTRPFRPWQPASLCPQHQLQPVQVRTFASKRFHKKKIIRLAKGYRGRTNCYRIAIRRVEKAWMYAYRDRKNKKRNMRKLWITRLNAGVRQHGLTYSKFINMTQGSGVGLNRRMLADLAGMEPFSFKAVVDVVKMRTGGGVAAAPKVAA